MSQPKIFIGTAYSGENEFELCIKKIHSQKDINITCHHVVQNKPILEAFQDMYDTWTKFKYDNDMFIQIDADIILYKDTTILDIYNTIKGTQYNVISYPVFDHFTNTNIWALNSYRPSVKFVTLKDKYRPDMEYKNKKRFPGITLKTKAVAEHAPNPSIKHAFHFGWHRELRSEVSPVQKNRILNNLYNAPPTPSRLHAIAGAEAAKKYKKQHKDFSPIEYTNPIFKEWFDKYDRQTQEIN
jgi:hypothetical protein